MDIKESTHLHHELEPSDRNPQYVALDISGVNKAKVLRKMDLRIIPIVTVLYLFSFLDRGFVFSSAYCMN